MSIADDLSEAVRARDPDRVREILRRHSDSALSHDDHGATALHYAAESGDREIVNMLLDAGAEINARDLQFNATPAGWAIEYLRQRGGLLGVEIEDAAHAIANGDERLVHRYVARFPALCDAVDRNGTPLRVHAETPVIARSRVCLGSLISMARLPREPNPFTSRNTMVTTRTNRPA